jgi:SAM-dependent methyltransferase
MVVARSYSAQERHNRDCNSERYMVSDMLNRDPKDIVAKAGDHCSGSKQNGASRSFTYTGVANLELSQEAKKYNRHLLGLLTQNSGGATRALDLGAGMGSFSIALREMGLDVTCIEPDILLRDRLQALGLNAYESLDALKDGSISFSFALNVLEHILDDRAAVKELFTKLEPGGIFLVYVPAFEMLFTSMDRQVGHFRRYSRSGLIALLRSAGFEIESIRYVDCLGFLASLGFKLLDNGSGQPGLRALRIYDRWFFPASVLLDKALDSLIGKNLLAVAFRPIKYVTGRRCG